MFIGHNPEELIPYVPSSHRHQERVEHLRKQAAEAEKASKADGADANEAAALKATAAALLKEAGKIVTQVRQDEEAGRKPFRLFFRVWGIEQYSKVMDLLGVDPSEIVADAAGLAKVASEANSTTFGECMRETLDAGLAGWEGVYLKSGDELVEAAYRTHNDVPVSEGGKPSEWSLKVLGQHLWMECFAKILSIQTPSRDDRLKS